MADKGDRVKEAIKRDVDQTAHDLTRGKKGADLDQDASDTIKQATGKEPIPPRGEPNHNK